MTDDELRDALAAALCDLGGGSTDGWEPFADALLPVIRQYAADCAARERAAYAAGRNAGANP
jgi:hypothetical protein